MGRKKKETLELVKEQVQEVQTQEIQIQEQDSLQFLRDYLIKYQDDNVYELFFEGKTILVKQYLDVQSKAIMIDTICSGSFVEEDNIKIYKPIFTEFLFDYYIAKYYTDLNIFEGEYTETYDLLKSSGLIDKIKEVIPQDELMVLIEKLDEAIEEQYRVIEQENSFMNVAKSLMKQFSEMDFEGMSKQLEELKKSELLKGLMDGKL